jgi:hypothetical protein
MKKHARDCLSALRKKLPGQITCGPWQLTFCSPFYFEKTMAVAAWMTSLDLRRAVVLKFECARAMHILIFTVQ